MKKKIVIALDQGTTSSRAIAFSPQGKILASSANEFHQYFPNSGWVEHDPEDIWQSSLSALRDVLQQVDTDQVAGIGISNQRETTLIWERKTLQPMARAIVWQDRRTADLCAQIKDTDQQYIQAKTGLLVDPYFCASKIAWLLDKHALRARARSGELAFGTVESYLIARFSAGKKHISDISNCSRTMLFDIHECAFKRELCDLWDIPMELLPEVCANTGELATIDKELFGIELPILAAIGDQQAALVGQGCTRAGMVKSTYGTGAFVLMNTGAQPKTSQNRLLSTIAYQVGDKLHYALEGSIFQAGTIINWLVNDLALADSPSRCSELAASVADNAGVYLVPAFTGLGAPWWDAQARGLLCGLTRASSRAHLVRAGLESIAYQSHDLITAMAADSGVSLDSLRVDGGVSKSDWLLQWLADICQCSVDRPQVVETTALGAGVLAALQAGLIDSIDQIDAMRLTAARFQASMPAEQRQQYLQGWRQAVQRTLT